MSSSDSSSAASPSQPTPSYQLASRPSSGSRLKSLAKSAALVAAPELAVPLDLIGSSKRSSARSSQQLSDQVIMVPPQERRPLIHWGKERIKVTHKKGLTFVQIERPHGVGLGEGLLLVISGIVSAGVVKRAIDWRAENPGASWTSGAFVTTKGSTLFGVLPYNIYNLPLGIHVPY